jgi:hypothetical protein
MSDVGQIDGGLMTAESRDMRLGEWFRVAKRGAVEAER